MPSRIHSTQVIMTVGCRYQSTNLQKEEKQRVLSTETSVWERERERDKIQTLLSNPSKWAKLFIRLVIEVTALLTMFINCSLSVRRSSFALSLSSGFLIRDRTISSRKIGRRIDCTWKKYGNHNETVKEQNSTAGE